MDLHQDWYSDEVNWRPESDCKIRGLKFVQSMNWLMCLIIVDVLLSGIATHHGKPEYESMIPRNVFLQPSISKGSRATISPGNRP